MSDRDFKMFGLGLCTGATATLVLAMLFWALGIGS